MKQSISCLYFLLYFYILNSHNMSIDLEKKAMIMLAVEEYLRVSIKNDKDVYFCKRVQRLIDAITEWFADEERDLQEDCKE